jgi:hypothetical protein
MPIAAWTEHNQRLPGLSVIHLAVDPGMSPKEVTESYLEERKRLLGTRYRDLNEKHLTLAVFIAIQPSQLGWSERMAQWNHQYASEGWTYTQVANFSHDCLQAQRRLLRSEAPVMGPANSSRRAQRRSGGASGSDSEEARHVEARTK